MKLPPLIMISRHIAFLLLAFFHCYAFAEGRGNGGGINTLWMLLLGLFVFLAYQYRTHIFVITFSAVAIAFPVGMGVYLLSENNLFGLIFIAVGGFVYHHIFNKSKDN
jgi:hypothetical protein